MGTQTQGEGGEGSSRFSVHGSRFSIRSSRFTIRSSRFTVHDSRFTIRSSRFTIRRGRVGWREEGGKESKIEREREGGSAGKIDK